ncbi:kinase-like protein [Thelephora ganbajun]|uniref:Kinase-like protein n=1 Tax=Thelephora ganbajun TaxID=370292 RepID=A0ACB6YXZ4_THEGA|nr:kinase-like protein [Thelephora ganbajun]
MQRSSLWWTTVTSGPSIKQDSRKSLIRSALVIPVLRLAEGSDLHWPPTSIPLNPKNHEQAAPAVIASLQGLVKLGETAVASGGTTDIWRGAWGDNPVALKAFRIYPLQDLQEAKEILWNLVPTWKQLAHENVLPFHGVDTSIFQLALVYEWGHNGTIMQYLESHPDASRPELLLQVAKGLQYLHSRGIVHGNLKGANVLISESGKVQICDYGLSPITSNSIAENLGVARSPRWLAPEIIGLPSEASSKSADVFAFAMLAVEVFTGRTPFEDTNDDLVIANQILDGKRPAKPQAGKQPGITAKMWKFIKKCWNASPNKRPTIDEVVRTWEGFVNGDNNRSLTSVLNFWKRKVLMCRKWFCGLF